MPLKLNVIVFIAQTDIHPYLRREKTFSDNFRGLLQIDHETDFGRRKA